MKRRDFLRRCGSYSTGICTCVLGVPFSFTSRASAQTPEATGVSVLVLGTAQDGGLPQLACHCPNCTRARQDPGFRRLIVSLAILDHRTRQVFLVDASPDIREQIAKITRDEEPGQGERENPVDGIILTHAHIGHYTGLMFFGYESLSSRQLPVFCSRKMAAFLRDNGPWSQLVRLENIALKVFPESTEIQLTSQIFMRPLRVPHRDEYSDTFGIRIRGPHKKLLYIPDIQNWRVWQRDIREEIEKVDFALLDGTFFSPEELPGRDLSRIGHPFIRDSMDLMESTVRKKATQVFFTHLNHSNPALDPAGRACREIENRGFALAQEEQEIRL